MEKYLEKLAQPKDQEAQKRIEKEDMIRELALAEQKAFQEAHVNQHNRRSCRYKPESDRNTPSARKIVNE
jgi:hypothetical protein